MHNYTHKGYKPNQGKANALFSQSGQVVATVALDQDGTRFAKKRISSSKHALRTPPALAVDTCVLDQAERKGCIYFEVFDKDTNQTYRADLVTFRAHGFPVSRGFGPQTALTYPFWTTFGSDGNAIPRLEPKPIDPSMVGQRDLFTFGGQA